MFTEGEDKLEEKLQETTAEGKPSEPTTATKVTPFELSPEQKVKLEE
jgi:hypothetical protein